ncbi:thermitase-like [Folsomia candida]|uniref:thermitase-like n=1 Tax=Folsomia candida TaxID=158441 RepID=UPI000B90316B|nr:thermitase-like [Folsomia candida]
MKVFILLLVATASISAGRIDPSLSLAVYNGETEAILELPEVMSVADSNAALSSLPRDAKISALVATLQGLTSAAQAPLISVAASLGLATEQYWASNIILVKGLTSEKLAQLASTPGDFIIRPHYTAMLHPTTRGPEVAPQDNTTQTPQWGVAKINAPAAWATTQGEGIVVAIIDTGVNLRHTALTEGYAGAWSDPFYNTPNPTDVDGHGSHCAGTILGRANGVGVAPGARWIACRGLNNNGGTTEAALTTCAQFMLTADPKPHIVSASWRQPTTVDPGNQPNLIAVGSTTDTDALSSFSSRGPSPSGALKPQVSAPGSNVVSCGTGANDYVTMSGTSMATPHTAGAIALILSANPTFDYDQVVNALSTSAFEPPVSNADRNCGLPGPGDFPNNAYGYGRIDVAAALGV